MYERVTYPDTANSKDPVLSCALEGAASVVAGIQDVSIVIHSPQGCASTVAAAYDSHEVDFTRRKIGCTRLFETDIILGATAKLEKMIRQAQETFAPKVMFVVGTCSADIIGEDIEAVCRTMQPEIDAQLIPVVAGGFRGNSYNGIDLGLEALFPLIRPTILKMRNTVNLIAPQANANPTWQADLQWVTDTLSRLGIEVNAVFCHETTLEKIGGAASAAANILLSHECGLEFAERMEEEHGVPLILRQLPLPIGLDNTARWLRAVGKQFDCGDQVEQLIREEEDRVISILRKRALMMIPRYRNCRIALCADSTLGIGMLRMLFHELEMIPDTVVLRYCTDSAKKLLEEECADLGISPKVVLNADGYQTKKALQELAPDAVIGSAWEKYMAEELGYRVAFDVFEPTNRVVYVDEPYFGYDGMLHLLQVFANDWERSFRSKKIEYKTCAPQA